MAKNLLALLALSGTVFAESLTIGDEPDYRSLRPCASNCFFRNADNNVQDKVLKCPRVNYYYQNECFCRADLIGNAEEYLDKCVMSRCANAVDAASATSVYLGYCETALGEAPAVVTTEDGTVTTETATLNAKNTGESKATTTAARPGGDDEEEDTEEEDTEEGDDEDETPTITVDGGAAPTVTTAPAPDSENFNAGSSDGNCVVGRLGFAVGLVGFISMVQLGFL